MNPLMVSLLLLMGAFRVIAAPTFTSPVTLTADGPAYRIAFSISESTDVTVEIVDSTDRVVRHLASGRLGANPPAPLAANTLSQSLIWDRTDDDGLPVFGAFRVKVLLGLSARFDRIYGNAPVRNLTGYIRGLACDTNGDLVILTGGYRGENSMTVYGRDGAYRRTLHPYPGDLPDAQLDGFGRLRLDDGRRVPLMYQGHHGTVIREFHNPYRQQMALAPQGWAVIANTNATSQWYGYMGSGRRALLIGLDGSCPLDSVMGPAFPGATAGQELFLAVTPAGDSLYMAGATAGTLYKGALAARNALSPFVTAGLSKVKGLATDGQGRLYVCDSGSGAVKVYSPAGALLDSIAVPSPNLVQVSRKDGALYVITVDAALPYVKLLKYSAYPALDSLYGFTITWQNTTMRYERAPVIALDAYAPNPVVWVGQTVYNDPNGLIQSYEDNGSALLRRSVNIGKPSPSGWKGGTQYAPGYLAVSPDERILLAGCRNWSRVDLETGAITASKVTGTEVAFSPDGSIYASGVRGYTDSTFWRYDRNETRIALPNGALEWKGPSQYCWGPDYGTRGFVVTRNRFYILHAGQDPRGGAWQAMAPDSANNNFLGVYDSALNLIDGNRLNGPSTMSGIQVDRQGNLYAGFNVRPKGFKYPDSGMAALLPNPLALTGNAVRLWSPYAAKNYYLFLYGSLLKFPASGGRMGFTDGRVDTLSRADLSGAVPAFQTTGFYDRVVSVQGASWQQFGLSLTPVQLFGRGDPYCICFTSRFAVDPFGRVFYPDAFRAQVSVLDNNKNEILKFGAYGNADQLGEGSARPNPAIPMAYPASVVQINRSVYISDPSNRRVLRVKLVYADSSVAAGNLSVERTPARVAELSVYPTPFNPSLHIRFSLAAAGAVAVRIFGPDGRLVRDLVKGLHDRGIHHLIWDGRTANGLSVPSGLYAVRIDAGGRTERRTAMLVK